MEINQDTIKKLRGLILFTVAVVVAGVNYRTICSVLLRIFNVLFPFLLGGAIAFILNVPMRALEQFFPDRRGSKLKRPVCLTITIFFVMGIIFLVFFVVAPELIGTVKSLKESIPLFLENIFDELTKWLSRYPELQIPADQIVMDWEKTLQGIMEFLKTGAGTLITTTFTAAKSIVSGAVSFGIGLIFAVYILLQKERLAGQAEKVMMAYLPERTAGRIKQIAVLTEKTFSNFLAGQCLEAVILGMMFFITMTVLRMPYAVLIGVLIAFTALIPVFGSFVGCGVGIFLFLMISPVQAAVFVVLFLVLQQIEGNLIYPYVVGNSVGLPSIWVLVAVTVGGNAMGVFGMLIFIPLCSVLYTLLREQVAIRLAEKKKAAGSGKRRVRERN